METLRIYLNSLPVLEQDNFANKCGTTRGYLRKQISSRLKLGASICLAIEEQSNGVVTRKDLRPNDWHKIWLDLRAAI